jgi:hypothetical protein
LRCAFGNARNTAITFSKRIPGTSHAICSALTISRSGSGTVSVMPSPASAGSNLYCSGS